AVAEGVGVGELGVDRAERARHADQIVAVAVAGGIVQVVPAGGELEAEAAVAQRVFGGGAVVEAVVAELENVGGVGHAQGVVLAQAQRGGELGVVHFVV